MRCSSGFLDPLCVETPCVTIDVFVSLRKSLKDNQLFKTKMLPVGLLPMTHSLQVKHVTPELGERGTSAQRTYGGIVKNIQKQRTRKEQMEQTENKHKLTDLNNATSHSM